MCSGERSNSFDNDFGRGLIDKAAIGVENATSAAPLPSDSATPANLLSGWISIGDEFVKTDLNEVLVGSTFCQVSGLELAHGVFRSLQSLPILFSPVTQLLLAGKFRSSNCWFSDDDEFVPDLLELSTPLLPD